MRPGQPVGALKLIFLDIHAEDGIGANDKLIGNTQSGELVDLRT